MRGDGVVWGMRMDVKGGDGFEKWFRETEESKLIPRFLD